MENKDLTARELELQEAREELMAEAFMNLEDGESLFENASEEELQNYASIFNEFNPDFDSNIPQKEQEEWRSQNDEN